MNIFKAIALATIVAASATPAATEGCFYCLIANETVVPGAAPIGFYALGGCRVLPASLISYAQVSQSYCISTQCSNPDGSISVNVEGQAFNQVRISVTRNGIKHELFHPIGLGTDYSCDGDVYIGNNYVVVRHGDNRDLVAMYGIESTGKIVGTGVHIYDGSSHGIEIDASNFVVRFGENKDNTTRFCFSDQGWSVSAPEARNGASTGQCNAPYPASLYSQ